MNERPIAHEFEGEEMESVLIYPDGAPYPAVLMFPTVAGIADLERGFAHRLADRGLSVMIADFYGKQYRGCPRPQAVELMGNLRSDRARCGPVAAKRVGKSKILPDARIRALSAGSWLEH